MCSIGVSPCGEPTDAYKICYGTVRLLPQAYVVGVPASEAVCDIQCNLSRRVYVTAFQVNTDPFAIFFAPLEKQVINLRFCGVCCAERGLLVHLNDVYQVDGEFVQVFVPNPFDVGGVAGVVGIRLA
jgi:hypothetical protein